MSIHLKSSVAGASRCVVLTLCLGLLAACGQKGPLTLPKTPAAAASGPTR